ncbi:hypothetical protein O181_025210 [Austropuccinia psidii MF-1]|uniref:Uncharacterized protein n=1 Tax=Austropuccinia psidii MF-1 TaxID=1389203 RepID=A0A9Q3CM07_9BASI|nr:hypothetical protein [Austropuccinia psidii MF-1]
MLSLFNSKHSNRCLTFSSRSSFNPIYHIPSTYQHLRLSVRFIVIVGLKNDHLFAQIDRWPKSSLFKIHSHKYSTLCLSPGQISPQKKSQIDQPPGLAYDKVENWTSQVYQHLPFEPDPNLFEKINPLESPSFNKLEEILALSQESPSNNQLCNRLVYLIDNDLHAADELKTEIIKNSINLPSNLQITNHCFNLLINHRDINGYLNWLPLVSSTCLDSSPENSTFSTSETHLNEILKLAPSDITPLLRFLTILTSKNCLNKQIALKSIRHLVRTQSPSKSIEIANKIFFISKPSLGFSQQTDFLHDFFVLQLANQGYLSEALQLLFSNPQEPGSQVDLTKNTISPLTYQVLADQLLTKIKHNSFQLNDPWSSQLDSLIAHWYKNHQPSLSAWLAPNKSNKCQNQVLPSLTKKISKQYLKFSTGNFSHSSIKELFSFLARFKTLIDENQHPKFIKAAQLASELNQLFPLRESFSQLRKLLQTIYPQQGKETQEQFIKSLIFQNQLQVINSQPKSGTTIDNLMPSKYLSYDFKTRPDVTLLWAHSWMIYYQRSGQPRQAIEIFLDYFIPLGCDLKLVGKILTRRSDGFSDSSNPMSFPRNPKHQQLIHPTTGVLTVLYDSILSICPPKLLNLVFQSFLTQHYPSSQSLNNSFTNQSHPTISINHVHRLRPNFTSFRPFVRTYLKNKDVESSLEVLKEMHSACLPNQIIDEGGWIDLLEWCAIHSAGPKSKSEANLSGWGSQRKRKIKGWDGQMKEKLIYLVLRHFLKANSIKLINQTDFLEIQSSNDPVNLLPNLREEAWMSNHSNFLNSQSFKDFCSYNNQFPTLKLLLKIKSGFNHSGNKRGTKFINRLINFKMGKI